LRNAATQGDAEAMRILGVTYLQGMKGINPNQENAKIWLTRAAEKGEVSALTALGGAYLDGKGLPRRPRTGLHYLERAARAGDDTALAYLGSFYMNERFEDEAPDRTKGFKYLQAAVRKGNVGAMAALGRAYINGDLGDRQIKKGTRMLVKAAQRGHESARYALAEAYLQAQGLEKANRDYAQAWLQSVIAGDSELAVQTLAEMLADSDIRIPEIHAERGATLIGDRRRSPGGR
jgi:TPR repeat protein